MPDVRDRRGGHGTRGRKDRQIMADTDAEGADRSDPNVAQQARIAELETRVLKQRREIRRLRKRIAQLQSRTEEPPTAPQDEGEVLTAETLKQLHATIKGGSAA